LTEQELRDAYNAAAEAVEARAAEYDALAADAADEEVEDAKRALEDAVAAADKAEQRMKDHEAAKKAREKFVKLPVDKTEERKPAPIHVDEPEMYERGGFLNDLFRAQVQRDPIAADRIARHQAYEVQKRAVATSTLGGIIPPQYLVDMYAKAKRNGRVFADQVDRQELPAEGMSLIVPRLTGGAAAASQSSESSTVTTQDPTESDLTVNVRTIAGYLPVSRQTLERASYSEPILFEDLVARYFAQLDTQCINGSGSSGQHLGLLNTSSIATSAASTMTVAGVWPKIADVIQQINTQWGGLGIVADKIVMHPRRWGFFEAAFDSNNRPVFGISNNGPYFNVAGDGEPSAYGYVGRMHGLPVYTDANIPTTLGSGTNEDRILVISSNVVHLWERPEDPVTLGFEQQAGTSLQVQLVAYGYSAFTAGRYPDASGAVTGLTTPSF
jgi:HK97 family phage major capsid protein